MSPARRTCLDLYAEAPDPKQLVVRFDESPVQLIGEVREPISTEPARFERYDCEYRYNGTVSLFVCVDVNRSWRKVKVTEPRTTGNCAQRMRELIDVHYSESRLQPARPGQPVDPHRRRPL
jgi:hypothetical protein